MSFWDLKRVWDWGLKRGLIRVRLGVKMGPVIGVGMGWNGYVQTAPSHTFDKHAAGRCHTS